MEDMITAAIRLREEDKLSEPQLVFIKDLYSISINDVWSLNRWIAHSLWNYYPYLFDREMLGEGKWIEVHNLIDIARESL